MQMKSGLMLGVLVGLLGGCAGGAEDADVLTIRLKATQQNAGSIGQASLVGRGDVTGISYVISGVPDGASRPLRLYNFIYPGSCAELGAEPAYSMNDTTQTTLTSTGWMMSREVPVNLDTLRAGSHALVVRTSPADLSVDIFCGDIY